MVSSLTPAKGHKLLAHIKKSSERMKKKKAATDKDLQDSEEEEEEKKKKGKRGSWIRESSSGGDPVDFLDRSLATRISC